LKPGWAKRIQILNEHYTLFRGQSGEAHLVQDRCPHRNTQLSIGWVEQDAIRCFYHGWKFAADGTCLEQPCEKANFAGKVAIRAYPTREYLGFIFAYLGEGAAPAFPRYPEIEEDNGFPLWNSKWDLPHNFFQRMENDLDEAHVHFVHKTSADEATELSVLPDFDAKETDYGILRIGTRHHHRHAAPWRRHRRALLAYADAQHDAHRRAAIGARRHVGGASCLARAGHRRQDPELRRRAPQGPQAARRSGQDLSAGR
jgi:phenylpropionate dioxygenase-like ring-hydroxylating dioxygenase large terminal subunit